MENIKKELKYALLPGVLIGLLNSLGYTVKNNGKILFNAYFIVLLLIGTVFVTVIVACLFSFFEKKTKRPIKTMDMYLKNKKLYLFIVTIVLILLWLPTYLSLFPGLFNYDSYAQLTEYNTLKITVHHPVLHTYIVGSLVCWGIMMFGTVNAGVIALMIFQFTIFTFLILYIFHFLYEKKLPMAFHLVTLFIFTLFPPVTLHLFCVTKDNFFSLFVIDFVLINFDLFMDTKSFFEKKNNIILWVIFALGTSIFRNNAIYPVIMMCPVWLFFFVRKRVYLKKGLLMFASFLLILYIYEKPFTDLMVVTDLNVKREAYSVPIQQLARVDAYHHYELEQQEIEQLYKLFSDIPVGMYYQPLLADNPKACFNYVEFENNKQKYIDLYLSFMKKYPQDYVNSFLENTYGFWYMWPKLILTYENVYGYMFIRSYDIVEMHSYFPWLLEVYKLFEDSKLVNDNYIWSCIFMPGTYFYIMLVVFFYGVKIKNKNIIGCLFFVLLLWLTFLLGPVVLVRYALYLYMLVPIELAMIYLAKKNVGNDKDISCSI